MKYRYRNEDEMKDSGVEWIGKIPLYWNVKRNKNLYEINKNLVGNKSSEYKVLSLTLRGVIERDFADNAGKIPASFDGYQIIDKNSILLCLFDMDVTPRISGYVPQKGIVSPAYTNINATNEQVNNKFYSYWFLRMDFEKILLSQSKSLRNTLTNDNFLNLPIISLESKEQMKIAKFLDEKTAEFDSIISKKEALIQKLEEAKKSLISEVVTGKVKVVKSSDGYELVERKKDEMKDSGIEWLGDIPKEWTVSKLKYNLSKIGSGKTPKGGAEVYVDTGVVFIRSQNVYNDGLRLDDVVFISDEINNEMNNTSVEYDDILLNITGGSIGRSSIVDILDLTANVNQHVCILRPIPEKINPILLHSIVQSNVIQTQIKSFQNASNREGLNFEQIADMMFVKSNDINEQSIIAKYIENVVNNTNNIIKMTRGQIDKIKEAKQSLISEAVTGKIEVLD